MLRWRGGSRGLVIGILLNKVKEVHVFIHLLGVTSGEISEKFIT